MLVDWLEDGANNKDTKILCSQKELARMRMYNAESRVDFSVFLFRGSHWSTSYLPYLRDALLTAGELCPVASSHEGAEKESGSRRKLYPSQSDTTERTWFIKASVTAPFRKHVNLP